MLRFSLYDRFNFSFFLLLLLSIMLSGCFGSPIPSLKLDISSNEILWGGYRKSETYRIQKDIFLVYRKSPTLLNDARILAPPLNLTGGRGKRFRSPQSVQEYIENPSKWAQVDGVIKAGTILECHKLIKYMPLGFENTIYLYAKIKTGEFKGSMVEISDISRVLAKSDDDIFLFEPDPELIIKHEN